MIYYDLSLEQKQHYRFIQRGPKHPGGPHISSDTGAKESPFFSALVTTIIGLPLA